MLPSAANMQSMSGFVHFFLVSDLSYVTTRNLDVLILGCIVDPNTPHFMSFLDQETGQASIFISLSNQEIGSLASICSTFFPLIVKKLGGVRVFDKQTELATWRAL